ncbi:hypothetical protein [Roseateles sp.]|uniref:hypothetical protein n=1 Tax=Roseateles sp. TaxID=1971397 RepID=UPI003D133B43
MSFDPGSRAPREVSVDGRRVQAKSQQSTVFDFRRGRDGLHTVDPENDEAGSADMTDAKRRAIAQKIGRQGELIFEQWATEGNFSANKLQDDYGIDYLCQQMLPTANGQEEITGLAALVQVRATTAEKAPRIGFDRVDVETALRQSGVFCAAAVALADKQVHFRFLDLALLETWVEFLRSDRQSISMRLDTMRQGIKDFSDELASLSRHSQRARFMKARARLQLEEAIPGALMRTNSGDAGDWATVVVPNLMSIVSAQPDQHEALAAKMFRPVPFPDGLEEILTEHRLHASLFAVKELVDGPLWVAGVAEHEVMFELSLGEDRVESPFLMRRVGDERAYIGASGLVLRITDARHDADSGQHLHRMSFSVEGAGARTLADSGQLDFLRMLRPGARLNEAGRPLLPVEAFDVSRFGRSIEAIELVCDQLKIPLSDVTLSDLADETFARNLGVLEAILALGERPVFPAFVLELEDDEIREEQWKGCVYRVPVTFGFKQHSLVAWIEGSGEVYLHDGVVRGLRFITKESAEVIPMDAPLEDTRASAHFHSGWAPLILGCEVPAFGKPLVTDLKGEIRPG